jgi:hypothetical protein
VPAIGVPRLPLVPDPLRRIEVPADLEGAVAGALITSGKPVLYPELPNLWAVMRRIGAEAPKSDSSALAFPATT